MAKVVKNNITYNSAPSTATLLPYNNTDSGLSATTTKGAIDELADEKADKTDVPEDLEDLDNVSISSATNGQVLKYNGINWVNANESGGSIVSVTQIQSAGTKIATITVDSVDTDLYAPNGGAASLDDLTDVTITSISDGQVIIWDSVSNKWVNTTLGDGTSGFTKTALYSNTGTLESVIQLNQSMQNFDLIEIVTNYPYSDSNVYYQNAIYTSAELINSIGQTNPVNWHIGNDSVYTWVIVTDVDEFTVHTVSTGLTVGVRYVYGYKFNGGGSGGHIIVDDAGTDLTQRTNLQFKGAYSEDNSTDDTTEVNVVREMTKAEFDLLSDNEKVGIINITDITSSNMGFQPVIYSEDEREIGVWIDGKPVYEKTIDFSSDLTVSYNGWTETTEDCSTVDRYLLGNGYTNSGTYGGNILCSKKSNNKLEIQTPRNGTTQSVRYLTIRYTKTTDTAGSGQWTPQGVPAHHYSENEHVVGTWVDGSTLYEKTTIFLNQQLQGGDTYLSLGISNLAIVVDSSALITNSDHTNIRPMNSWHLDSAGSQMWYRIILSSGELMIHTEGTWTSPNIYITLRYTKSSS